MASKEARDARLDALAQAVGDWATARRKALNTQVAFGRRLLRGRTGSERLAQESVESASALTVDKINEFLVGE